MAIRDILVHVDKHAGAEAQVRLAVELAERHDAHLTGLHVKANPVIPAFEDYAAFSSGYLDEQYRAIDARAAEAQGLFDAAVRRADIAFEWRVARGYAADAVHRQSRYADLVIVGQHDPDGDDMGGLPDGVLLATGRPTLIVPYAGPAKTFARNVMIAWDDGVPATRAVHDALPLVADAERVSVVAVNAEKTGDYGEIRCADICLHLARHGITAEAQTQRADGVGVADVLLARASEQGCDLLVMGAYGHSRLREFILGGTTAQMLESMTIPVLMSH